MKLEESCLFILVVLANAEVLNPSHAPHPQHINDVYSPYQINILSLYLLESWEGQMVHYNPSHMHLKR